MAGAAPEAVLGHLRLASGVGGLSIVSCMS
jgi:hypothetical protein